MKIFNTINELRNELSEQRANGKKIGFVPTMGYLHEGHASLLKAARKDNDIVVLSIFVNPTQFGPNEDLSSYPRDFERDEKVAQNSGVDYIFYPNVEEMYPSKLKSKLQVINGVNVLCGEKRPGHFDGVALVVTKLFNIVQPHNVYFGLKDAQQVAVIEGLIEDYNIPVTLNKVPIVREEDGLAKSSRNVYLSEQERAEAPTIFKSLQNAKALIDAGERNSVKIEEEIKRILEEKTSGEVDYVNVYSYPELNEITEIKGTIIIAIALKFTKARLIDNIILTIS
ncbi:pantoate--beta-alanine ligase [Bacillus sp. RG28]|uniref:Pantothenate synthetase n=1 Tax=Gottfriedia endophytica TaxID=2820819 RepID=A0A940SFN6_9BACI|nr:pantoate--beta-alanine ligase [Gottfriedia endophytica]MBP0724187.1 pantoate--beta-alanine ligase [Gottfriedia endophytica]